MEAIQVVIVVKIILPTAIIITEVMVIMAARAIMETTEIMAITETVETMVARAIQVKMTCRTFIITSLEKVEINFAA